MLRSGAARGHDPTGHCPGPETVARHGTARILQNRPCAELTSSTAVRLTYLRTADPIALMSRPGESI